MRLFVLTFGLLLCGIVAAQTPARSIDAIAELNASALAAQQRIDRLYAERQQILQDINTIELEGSTFALRNRELEQSIGAVRQNLFEIEADLTAINETQTGIIALLSAMIDALQSFVELDLPFERSSRLAIISRLRSDLLRADIGVTEKYQSVVSAYLNEVRLGHGNAVSQEQIETTTGRRHVDILRLGRAGLWYVTADGSRAGRWDPVHRLWIDGDTDPETVRTGIRMVQESGSSTLIRLPIQLSIN